MKRLHKWPKWVHYCVWFSAAACGFGGAVILTGTRPADSGVVEPPVPVTCRGILAEPGFYHGRVVRLDTVGMRPGANPNELSYERIWALPPEVVCRFDRPVPVPTPRHVVGRCRVSGKLPVLVLDCRPD